METFLSKNINLFDHRPVLAPVAMGQRAVERVVVAVSSKGSEAKWPDLDLKCKTAGAQDGYGNGSGSGNGSGTDNSSGNGSGNGSGSGNGMAVVMAMAVAVAVVIAVVKDLFHKLSR